MNPIRNNFLRQFQYDAWANREVMKSLREGTAPRAFKFLAHILAAQHVWFCRIRPGAEQTPVWPEWQAAECGRRAQELGGIWRDYLRDCPDDELSRLVAYQNSKGESFQSTVADILTHVVLHSAYHRGQIALEMRGAGLEPAYTDFIHAVRQGNVDAAII